MLQSLRLLLFCTPEAYVISDTSVCVVTENVWGGQWLQGSYEKMTSNRKMAIHLTGEGGRALLSELFSW